MCIHIYIYICFTGAHEDAQQHHRGDRELVHVQEAAAGVVEDEFGDDLDVFMYYIILYQII